MALFKRKPKTTKPASHWASITGLSPKTIKRKFKAARLEEIRYSKAPTAEVYYFERDGDAVIAQLQGQH